MPVPRPHAQYANALAAVVPQASERVIRTTAADLPIGSRLLTLGGIGMPQATRASARPVLVCSVHPIDGDDNQVDITTSAGVFTAAADTPAAAVPVSVVGPETVLLVSRRPALHGMLLTAGVPVVRRTPTTDDTSARAVSAEEWTWAPLIVIDAHLAPSTLRAMRARPDLMDRAAIVLVEDNPDSPRGPVRAAAARARAILTVPMDAHLTQNLFTAAVTAEPGAFPGVLSPAPAGR